MPASSAPFGIPGSPKVELPARGGEAVQSAPTAGAQLKAVAGTAVSLPTTSLNDVMRQQAECGFDRGPCVRGIPLEGIKLQPAPRGLARLDENVREEVLKTKRGAELGAQEVDLRSRMAESKAKAAAIADRMAQAKGEEKSKIQVELVRERTQYDQLKQKLVKVALDVEKYAVDFTERKDSTPTDRKPEAAPNPPATRNQREPPSR